MNRINRLGILCVVILALFFLPKAKAQNQKEPYFFNLKFHNGFVMQHSVNMAHLANQHPWGLEADLYRITMGKKKWQAEHNFPKIGYSFMYFHMDPKKPLGDSYSLIIYYSQNIFKTNKLSLSYRIGFGPGYIEKRFNLRNNYKDNLNSTRLNFGLNGRINLSYQIVPKLHFITGFGLMHYSNGAFKVPNLGINLVSTHIGFSYTPMKNPVLPTQRDTSRNYSRKIQYYATLAGGLKQNLPVGSKKWFASTMSFYVGKQVSRRSVLNIGTELFYDHSNKTLLDTMSNPSNKFYYKWGVMVGHEYLIGKLSLLTQVGYYLFDPVKINKPIYQRVGFKYYFAKHIFASMNLKTHFGQADYVEWGLGVKF